MTTTNPGVTDEERDRVAAVLQDHVLGLRRSLDGPNAPGAISMYDLCTKVVEASRDVDPSATSENLRRHLTERQLEILRDLDAGVRKLRGVLAIMYNLNREELVDALRSIEVDAMHLRLALRPGRSP